jgi:hypothetical protein
MTVCIKTGPNSPPDALSASSIRSVVVARVALQPDSSWYCLWGAGFHAVGNSAIRGFHSVVLPSVCPDTGLCVFKFDQGLCSWPGPATGVGNSTAQPSFVGSSAFIPSGPVPPACICCSSVCGPGVGAALRRRKIKMYVVRPAIAARNRRTRITAATIKPIRVEPELDAVPESVALEDLDD